MACHRILLYMCFIHHIFTLLAFYIQLGLLNQLRFANPLGTGPEALPELPAQRAPLRGAAEMWPSTAESRPGMRQMVTLLVRLYKHMIPWHIFFYTYVYIYIYIRIHICVCVCGLCVSNHCGLLILRRVGLHMIWYSSIFITFFANYFGVLHDTRF